MNAFFKTTLCSLTMLACSGMSFQAAEATVKVADQAPALKLAPLRWHPFGDKAVFQQVNPIPVWGWPLPGSEVAPTIDRQKKSAVAGKEGRWLVTLDLQRADKPGPDKERFIDTHVHFHDRKVGDLEKVVAWMQANNVQRVINHPLAQSRPRNDEERKQMLANYANYQGRIDRFCIVFPEEVNSVEEAVTLLTREKQDGAIGFGEHYGVNLAFDDPKNLRLYAACSQVGLPVMFHMDRNKNLDEQGLPRLQNVMKQYPDCILIAHSDWWKHLGAGTCDQLLQTYPNLYADISCTVARSMIGRDKEFARAFFIRHADKLLFGTDSGWWSLGNENKPMPEFALIDELKLPKEVEDKICRGNAGRLFWRKKPDASW